MNIIFLGLFSGSAKEEGGPIGGPLGLWEAQRSQDSVSASPVRREYFSPRDVPTLISLK